MARWNRRRRRHCEVCGGGIMRADTDLETDAPIWACQNCSNKEPRQIKHRRKDRQTPSQQRAVERIRVLHFEHQCHGSPEKHEIKRFDVRLLDWGPVEVISCVGMKGDEGTLAASLCRDQRQFFIGRNGKITLAQAPKAKGNAVFYTTEGKY